MSATLFQAFPRRGKIEKHTPNPTSHSTCSELRRVQRPLSGTSRSLQIPESPRSHRARRGQATRRTGGVSQCALPRSEEDTDWPRSVNPKGGQEDRPLSSLQPGCRCLLMLFPPIVHSPAGAPADSCPPSSPTPTPTL